MENGILAKYMTDEQKELIIKKIIEHVNRKKSVTISFVANSVLGTHVKDSDARKINREITESGKYSSNPIGLTFEIYKTPNYRPKWQEWLAAVLIAILSAVFTLVIDKSLDRPHTLKGDPEYEQLKKRVDQIEKQTKHRPSLQKNTMKDK